MKTLTTAALLLSLAASAFAGGEAPKGFRSLLWGNKAPPSLTKVTGPTSDGTSLYAPAKNTKLQPILDLPVAEEAYSFTLGKFYSGTVWFDSRENFEKAKQFLLKTYGKPEFANEALEIYKWKWPSSKIEVHLSYQKKFARTTLTYINNAI